MKILATGDLHYGLKKQGDLSTSKLVEEVNSSDADIFIITGDTADGTLNFEKCLNLFCEFKGHKLIVSGNHDIWTNGNDSLYIYNKKLEEISAACGFHYLDRRPFVLNGTGFVGSMGWYDFSFRLKDLNIPLNYYEEKYYPKVARWNDKKYIKWDYTDYTFLDYVLDKMKRHIEEIKDSVDIIISVTHHLPFKEMTIKTGHPPWDFAQAYLGSTKLGDLILGYEKIKFSLCGHSHRGMTLEKGHIKCINVGSDYNNKKLITLEI